MCDINRKMLIGWCKLVCGLCAFLWLFTGTVEAQTVTLQGTVSETIVLSSPPNSVQDGVNVVVLSTGNTVRMTLSGTGAPAIRVPLLVRSNSGFKISASFESATAELTQLSVVDVRATGRLVSPEAVNNVEMSPSHVISGPRVSVGGTLNSPNNALQITLLIHLKPQSSRDWLVHLTFTADLRNAERFAP